MLPREPPAPRGAGRRAGRSDGPLAAHRAPRCARSRDGAVFQRGVPPRPGRAPPALPVAPLPSTLRAAAPHPAPRGRPRRRQDLRARARAPPLPPDPAPGAASGLRRPARRSPLAARPMGARRRRHVTRRAGTRCFPRAEGCGRQSGAGGGGGGCAAAAPPRPTPAPRRPAPMAAAPRPAAAPRSPAPPRRAPPLAAR